MSSSNEPPLPQILVIDDEPDICRSIDRYLSREGYRVHSAGNGNDLPDVVTREAIDLVVLDVHLPGKDGLTLARELRQHSPVPIIMLTSRDDVIDRVAGLEAGADDYLPKPFHPRELLARIRSVLRRMQAAPASDAPKTAASPTSEPHPELSSRQPTATSFRFNDWLLNSATHQLFSPSGEELALSPVEYDLLFVFLQNPNRVLSREFLLDQTRGRAAMPYDRSIDVHISHLRKKLEINPQNPKLIKTVRSAGYIFTSAVI